MKFILPRVLALTVIVGTAALVLSLLFKLLLCATILLGIGFAVSRAVRRHWSRNYDSMQGRGYGEHFGYDTGLAPFPNMGQHNAQRQPAGIIPIN